MKEGGTVRYANSGGRNRDYYKMLARTGRLQTGSEGAKVLEHVPGWNVGDKDPARYRASGSSSSSSAAAGKGIGAPIRAPYIGAL